MKQTYIISGEKCTLDKRQYKNGRIAIQSFDEHGFPYATLSVNLVNETINDDELFIDTNNCPSALENLQNQRVVGKVIRYGHSGFCKYPLVKYIQQ